MQPSRMVAVAAALTIVCGAWADTGARCVIELMRNFPHWFCSDFGKYADNERSMPFDSHLLMACVAPRKLLIEGFDDPFYDTEGEFEALKAASPVWTFLGRSGLPRSTWPDAYDVSAIGADIGYVRRTERHGLSAYDWTWIMNFAGQGEDERREQGSFCGIMPAKGKRHGFADSANLTPSPVDLGRK